MSEKKTVVILDALINVQAAHIPSVFLVFVGEVFGTSFAQIFCMPSVKISWTVG